MQLILNSTWPHVITYTNRYNFRKSFDMNVNKPKTELVGPSHTAAIAWNSLSDKIRSFSNPIAFKNWLKLSKRDIKNIKFEKGSSLIYSKSSDYYYY